MMYNLRNFYFLGPIACDFNLRTEKRMSVLLVTRLKALLDHSPMAFYIFSMRAIT